MKKHLTITFFITLLFTFSCNKQDNTGTLKVINETDCVHTIFDGVDSNTNLLGSVGKNESKNFTIELNDLRSSEKYFSSDPQICPNLFEEQYKVTINSNQVTTIVIK